MNEHRVSTLGSSLRRFEDPEQSRDPRVRTVVDALQNLDYAPAPSARFRAELRAQLVAVAPRIISESTPDVVAPAARRTSTRAGEPLSAQVRRRRIARPFALATGVAAALLMLFGGAVWKSQRSLPGDSLYGLKRASENVQLSLSSGGTDRGHTYLSLAQTRVQEARALLRRESSSAAGSGALAGGLSPQTAKLIADNLDSADSDVKQGSDLLNTQAVTAESQTPISIITGWAPGQLDRLHDLLTALPESSLQTQTLTSWTLTNSALTRARSLAPAVASGCASTSKSDHLGPLPTCAASSGTTRTTPAPSAPVTIRTAPASHPGSGATSRDATSGTAGTQHASTTPSTSAPAASAIPSTSVVPPLLPSVGLSVGSCGVSVGLGPIGIGLGGCPSQS